MAIEQPRRQGAQRPLRFYARCPSCWKILSCDEGVWPSHWWDDANPVMQCNMSGKKHETLETKRD